MADGTIELHLDPASSDFDPGDARWARDVDQLVAALAEDLGRAVVVRTEPAPLAKGLSGILLALGSAGALTTAVELIRLWLRPITPARSACRGTRRGGCGRPS